MSRPLLKQDASRFDIHGWDVICFTNGREGEFARAEELAPLIIGGVEPSRVLKHDHRSQVELLEAAGETYILKKFTLQRTWLWFQLTSLIFPTLGEVACKNAIDLIDAGVTTPRPLLLLQKLEKGMVVESWQLYRFLDGEPLSYADAAEIVDFVRRMHCLNWVHRDPHPGNFLRIEGGIATLDPVKARRSSGKFLKAYDVMLMEHDMPDAAEIYGREKLGVWLTLARLGHDGVRIYRSLKRTLRRLAGIKGNAGNFRYK